MADITKRFSDCEGEGERGKRGHRGPRGHVGATGPTGPAAPDTIGPFPSPPITTKIYAREDGDDQDGDGSIENPYRTFVRAAQDIPRQILPGNFVIVDITGSSSDTNPEVLPPNYALPAITGPFGVEVTYALPNAADYYPFTTYTSLEIIAKPQLATLSAGSNNLTAADFTASFDTETNLVQVQTNQVYGPDVLGKMVQDGIGLRGVVWNKSPGIGGDILYLTISQMQDQYVSPPFSSAPTGFPPGLPPGFPVGFGGFLQIVQQSAAFQTSKAPGSLLRAGFLFAGVGSVGLRGANIRLAPGNIGFDTEIWGSHTLFLEGAQIDGLLVAQSEGQVVLFNMLVHDGLFLTEGNTACFSSLFQRVGFNLPNIVPTAIAAFGFVFDTCTAFGPRYNPFQPVGRGPNGQVSLRNGFIHSSIPDFNFGQIAAPENFPAPFIPNSEPGPLQMPGFGIICRGGYWFVDHVKFSNAASDAIHVDGVGLLELKSVTGGGGGTVFGNVTDTVNAGWGLFATDSAQVRISDKDPTGVAAPPSLVIGSTGEIQAGEGPGITTTWGAVEGGTQALDTAGPNATLTRVFAKP